jgi:hypothetical protein
MKRLESGGDRSTRSPIGAAREERERLGKKEEKRKKKRPTPNRYRQEVRQP